VFSGACDGGESVCPPGPIRDFTVSLTCASDIPWAVRDDVTVRIQREDLDTWRECRFNESNILLPLCGPMGPSSIVCDVSQGGLERFAKYRIEAQIIDQNGVTLTGARDAQFGHPDDRCLPTSAMFNLKLTESGK